MHSILQYSTKLGNTFIEKSLHTKRKTGENTYYGIETRESGVCVWPGRLHVSFNFLIWIMVQVGVDHVFLNPIPFLVGSLCPDCDHPKAPIGRILPIWLFCKHRTITHSIYGLLAFSSLVSLYSLKWGLLFGAGYLLHLLEDSGTPMGINWWMTKKKARS